MSLIKKARKFSDNEDSSLGQLQRAMFEIQGQQALMQADALQIKILMDGYHQQEAAAGIREAGQFFCLVMRHLYSPRFRLDRNTGVFFLPTFNQARLIRVLIFKK